MKKRVFCLLLSAVLLLGTLTAALPHDAHAENELKASDDCIALLKFFEGFIEKPMEDYGQWTIGYGTSISDEDAERLKETGISEEEAEELLRQHVAFFEQALNKFSADKSRPFTQQEFDALLLFSYNCGSAWMSRTSEAIYQAVLNKQTDENFLTALVSWCSAGGEILNSLINRRLCEANIYLNGVYSYNAPSDYKYVIFDWNGGDCITDIIAFFSNSQISILPVPTKEGFRFVGWFTSKEGGEPVYVLDSTLNKATLIARWAEIESGEEGEEIKDIESASCDELVAVSSAGTFLYANSSLSAEVSCSVSKGTVLHVVAKGTDAGGKSWGKLDMGLWVLLSDTEPYEEEKPAVEVTVTVDFLNVRSGAGASFPVVTCISRGTKVSVTEVKKLDSGEYWGKYADGKWICLNHTDYKPESEDPEEKPKDDPEENPGKEDETKKELKVTVTASQLNVRKGPGTANLVTSGLGKGAVVTISSVKQVGNEFWGEISGKGWICLTYTTYKPGSETAEQGEEKEKEKEKEEEKTYEVPCRITCSALNVRSAPSLSARVVNCLSNGSSVTVTETESVSGILWGKIGNSMWISTEYTDYLSALAEIKKQESDEPAEDPGEKPEEEPEEKPTAESGYVTASLLNIRKGAGTSSAVVGTLPYHAAVSVTETKTVNGVKWGKISNGWICMTYVTLTNSGSSPSGVGTKYQVTGSYVNVRSAPSIVAAVVSGVSKGTYVNVTDTKNADGYTWGKIEENRWICMTYAKKAA